MSSILRNSLSAIKLPDSSRVWLFGAQRILTEIEEISIHRRLLDFIAGWQAHGKDLTADFCIIHRCVLVVVVDESKEAPSGCSIDKVFQLLQSQKEKFDLDFFQRTLVWAMHKGELCIFNKQEIQAGLDCGEMNGDMQVFNMLSDRLGELKSGGMMLPLKESWIAPKLEFTHER
ncbi:hypothetical protein LBMAG26_04920 [Bacteroidota bacterium]|nr:hypothetical protein LBMAG26_04920 [Bacteroidota bacterium]